VALDTIGKLPGLVTRAEAALDDYDAERRSPERRTTRAMFVAAFWVLIVIAATLVVRLFI
jgi:ubiquinone biosynthesis protein